MSRMRDSMVCMVSNTDYQFSKTLIFSASLDFCGKLFLSACVVR